MNANELRQLDALELRRKTAEALGVEVKFPKIAAWLAHLPAYESDNGVALAALMEFAAKHELLWRLHGDGQQAECWLSKVHSQGVCIQVTRSQHAITPALAICAAIVQAAEALR